MCWWLLSVTASKSKPRATRAVVRAPAAASDMPVSLERLIAEAEPAVITEELTRECIQVSMQGS